MQNWEGDGAVGAVVMGDIEVGVVVGGVPAKVIRKSGGA